MGERTMLDPLLARLPELLGAVVFALVAALAFSRARALKMWRAIFNGLSFFLFFTLAALTVDPRSPGQVIAYFGVLPWMTLVPLMALKLLRTRNAQSQENDPPFSKRRLTLVGLGYCYLFVLAVLMNLCMEGTVSKAIRFALLIDSGPAPLGRGFVAIGYVALLTVLVAPYRQRGKSSGQLKVELEEYTSELRGKIEARKRH